MVPTDFLCYYPTNIVVVDDSNSFLAMINKQLNSSQPRQLYNNPVEALNKINAAEKSSSQLNRILRSLSVEDVDELPPANYDANALVYIDFSHLYDEIYNPNRFDHISVVLVDYRMEQMNGIEFCRNIEDKAIVKIMVTEISDYKIAVQAFNEGLIDKFILKNATNFFNEVNISILKSQRDYFKNIYGFDGVLGFIFRNQLQFGALNYQEVIKQINDIIKPVEYYVLDKSGSILFLDERAKPVWLIVRTNSELDKLYSIAKDSKASCDLLDVLYCKQKMPILLCEEDYKLPINDWLMYPIKTFLSHQKEYYSIITNRTLMDVDLAKIFSFKQYIQGNSEKFYK